MTDRASTIAWDSLQEWYFTYRFEGENEDINPDNYSQWASKIDGNEGIVQAATKLLLRVDNLNSREPAEKLAGLVDFLDFFCGALLNAGHSEAAYRLRSASWLISDLQKKDLSIVGPSLGIKRARESSHSTKRRTTPNDVDAREVRFCVGCAFREMGYLGVPVEDRIAAVNAELSAQEYRKMTASQIESYAKWPVVKEYTDNHDWGPELNSYLRLRTEEALEIVPRLWIRRAAGARYAYSLPAGNPRKKT